MFCKIKTISQSFDGFVIKKIVICRVHVDTIFSLQTNSGMKELFCSFNSYSLRHRLPCTSLIVTTVSMWWATISSTSINL